MAYREDVDYQALINEAIKSGDYRSAAQYEQSRNEKINALNSAGGGTNKYGATATSNYANWLGGGSSATGSATGVGTHTKDQQSIKDEMNANSMQWYDASDEGKASLHAENEYLASLLGDGVTWDSQTGYWSGEANKPTTSSGAPTFDYSAYDQSKPTFESSYSAQIDDLLNKILNRDSFSYNAEEDPLFQQYRSTYQREGDRAMNDTLAAAASSAGGMNSYALSTAQQAQNYYGAQLSDKIPELYQLAYQMYLDDIEGQVRDLGLLQGMDDTQYGRYRDTMGDWRDDRDFAYGAYRDDMGDWQWQQNFDYNAGRDSVSDNRYTNETAYDRALSFLNAGVMPDSGVLVQAGISQAEAERILASLGGGTGSTGSTGNAGSTGNTGSTGDYDYTGDRVASALSGYSIPEGWGYEDVVTFQEENGLTGDGVWGPKTQAAYEAQNEEPEEEDDGIDSELANAIIQLGIGPVNASTVDELLSAQAIRENRGSFEWQKGWNAQNYREKLREKQQGGFGLFGF